MKIKLGAYLAPVAATLLLFLVACTSAAPTDSNAGESRAAADPAAGAAAASSRPAAIDRETLAAFAADQQAINAEWDKFHADFDTWRAGLTSCDRDAALTAAREFSGDFNAIAQQARDLPGTGITRKLAYDAIHAAAVEEAALRQLWDNWQPGSVNLLDERNAAAIMLRETADRLDELGELDKPEERAAAENFAQAFAPIDADWKAFHDRYDALRQEQAELFPAEVIPRLETLLNDFDLIIEASDKLPDADATEDIAQALAEAADREQDALLGLLEAFNDLAAAAAAEAEAQTQAVAEATESTNGLPDFGQIEEMEKEAAAIDDGAPADSEGRGDDAPAEPPPPEPVAEPEPEPEPVPLDNSHLFQDMDGEVENSDAVRKDARLDLENLIEKISEEDLAALDDFEEALTDLRQNWDAFHQDYDDWISAEGGCDRAAATQALAGFNQRFNELGAQVRGLSQAAALRPSSDLLVEALAGEAAALRSLHNLWRPFETDLYRDLDQQRVNADNLRRLADRRTQEVMERFGATP